MVIETLEHKRLARQRRTRRQRQRLLHSEAHLLNSNGTRHASTGAEKPKKELLISELGWTAEEALDTHYRLRNFALLWDGPGMEEYDEL